MLTQLQLKICQDYLNSLALDQRKNAFFDFLLIDMKGTEEWRNSRIILNGLASGKVVVTINDMDFVELPEVKMDVLLEVYALAIRKQLTGARRYTQQFMDNTHKYSPEWKQLKSHKVAPIVGSHHLEEATRLMNTLLANIKEKNAEITNTLCVKSLCVKSSPLSIDFVLCIASGQKDQYIIPTLEKAGFTRKQIDPCPGVAKIRILQHTLPSFIAKMKAFIEPDLQQDEVPLLRRSWN